MSLLLPALSDLSARLRHVPGEGLVLRDGGAERFAPVGAAATAALRDALYARYFCRLDAGAPVSRYAGRASGEPSFVTALIDATAGRTYLEPGWQVVKAEEGWAFVSNGRVSLFLEDRQQLEPAAVKPGAAVKVRLPCARENLAPGFFYLVGPSGPIDAASGHVRVYLSLRPQAAVQLVRALCTREGLERHSFEAKLVNDPAQYGRADAVVLYLPSASASALLTWLTPWCRAHGRGADLPPPLFTRPLGPGLAIAEVAAAGSATEGFGQRRCRLAAEEILAALEGGEAVPERWAARIKARFEAEGLGPPDGTPTSRGVARAPGRVPA